MPPVVPTGMVSLTFAIISGVLLVARIGTDASLVVPTVLVAGSIVLELVAIGMLGRIRPFAWWRFRQVLLWAVLAYIFQAGIIEWSFVVNDVPAGPMLVLTGGLVVFATIVPIMISFTVGRYQAVDV